MSSGDFRSFTWYDVRCSYDRKGPNGKTEQVEALHGISGHLESGHMLAVLGEAGFSTSMVPTTIHGAYIYNIYIIYNAYGMCGSMSRCRSIYIIRGGRHGLTSGCSAPPLLMITSCCSAE